LLTGWQQVGWQQLLRPPQLETHSADRAIAVNKATDEINFKDFLMRISLWIW
jgi:hypothetical protein